MANEKKSDGAKQRRKNRTLIGTLKAAFDAVKNGMDKDNSKSNSNYLTSTLNKYQWYMYSGQYRKPRWKRKTQRSRANFISNRKVG